MAWHVAQLAQRSKNIAKSFLSKWNIPANQYLKIIIPNKNQLLPPPPLNPTATDQSSNSPVQFNILLINLALKVAITNNLVINIIYCKKQVYSKLKIYDPKNNVLKIKTILKQKKT